MRSTIRLPGIPELSDLAYLAGLLDGGGHVAAAGLKLRGGPELLTWLQARFAGTVSYRAETWWLRRRADLDFLLPRLEPLLVVKRAECAALRAHLGQEGANDAVRAARRRRSE